MDNFASTYLDRHNERSPKVKTKYLGDNELVNFLRDGIEV